MQINFGNLMFSPSCKLAGISSDSIDMYRSMADHDITLPLVDDVLAIHSVNDGSLKPVNLKMKLEKKTIGPSDDSLRQQSVVWMTIEGKPWKYNPYYDQTTDRTVYVDNPLPRDEILAHDIMEHILTPWVGAMDTGLGEFVAGRVHSKQQLLPEGHQLWQPLLVNASKTFTGNALQNQPLQEMLKVLRSCQDGTTITFDICLPPPDRSFGYSDKVGKNTVKRKFGYSDHDDFPVDDLVKPTGLPWQPITFTQAVIKSDNDFETGILKTEIKEFEAFFNQYQQNMGHLLKDNKGWQEKLMDLADNGFQGYLQGFNALINRVGVTFDGGKEDYRRPLAPNSDNFKPAPTLMPAGAKGLDTPVPSMLIVREY